MCHKRYQISNNNYWVFRILSCLLLNFCCYSSAISLILPVILCNINWKFYVYMLPPFSPKSHRWLHLMIFRLVDWRARWYQNNNIVFYCLVLQNEFKYMHVLFWAYAIEEKLHTLKWRTHSASTYSSIICCTIAFFLNRVVFKWLSKVIMWLLWFWFYTCWFSHWF